MVRVEKSGRSALDVEVPEKPVRRKFTADYKLKILREADDCVSGTGELGELLRREGLYSSHLLSWRRQRDEGSISGLEPKKRGRKPKRRDAVAVENDRLRREVGQLEERLKQAQVIIEVQKKLSTLLGIKLPTDSNSGESE